MATATPAAMLRRTNGVTSWLTYLAVTVPATGLAAAAWMQTSELTAYV
jgi:hypothetical protein